MEKILLITGGSRGIGAATAIEAAKAGFTVCINYRSNSAAATKVVNQIKELGGTAFAFQADISSEKEVINMFQQIDEEAGTITALVNNAAIIDKKSSLEDISFERMESIFKTNVIGTLLCSKEAVKRMAFKHNGQGGTIVNISSGASKSGSPGEYIDYAASKGAIDTFTIGLAKEVGTEGIRVNGIRPGYIATEMHDQIGIPNRLEKVKSKIPMERVGQPIEIAHAILWLLSDKASYTSGAILDVTGGK